MLSFISRFYKINKINKTKEYPFNKKYRNGYKKLWINNLNDYYP